MNSSFVFVAATTATTIGLCARCLITSVVCSTEIFAYLLVLCVCYRIYLLAGLEQANGGHGR
jgi:hypothetical protein